MVYKVQLSVTPLLYIRGAQKTSAEDTQVDPCSQLLRQAPSLLEMHFKNQDGILRSIPGHRQKRGDEEAQIREIRRALNLSLLSGNSDCQK